MNSQCMFTAAQYCHCDGKAICVPPFWSSSTFIWFSLYLYCLQKSNFFYWQIRSTVVRLSIEFCTWQSKFEYILSCKLNFGIFLWMREREICLSAVVFFCKGDAICCSLQILFLAFWSRRRFYKVTWSPLLCVEAKEPDEWTCPCTFCSVIVQSNKASFLIYHSNLLSYFGDVYTCVHFFFHARWWFVCIKNGIKLHPFAIFAVQNKLPCCPSLKQTCVLLSVMCPHSDLGRTIMIILVFLYVGLQNVNG